jgi:hypothetical protein
MKAAKPSVPERTKSEEPGGRVIPFPYVPPMEGLRAFGEGHEFEGAPHRLSKPVTPIHGFAGTS